MTTQAREALLTAQDVAQMLGVSIDTIYDWIADGTLPAVRLTSRTLRFTPAAIDEFVESASTRQASNA
jgi:excisionase family DNA binding protein